MVGDLIPFTNVNELPQVTPGCRREFVEFQGQWWYADSAPNVFNTFRVHR